MANELNHTPHVMSKEEFLGVKNTIKSVRAQLSFTREMTDEDTKVFNKISDGDKVFIGDCLTEAEDAAGMLPPYLSISKIQTSDASHDQLWVLEDALLELYLHVRRNRMLAADDAFSGVSSLYNSIKGAAKEKVSGSIPMYERLKAYHMKKVEAAKAAKAARDKAIAEKAAAVAAAIADTQAKAAEEAQAKAAA
jgi:hypothetical protein